VLFVGLNSQIINSGLREEAEQWDWLDRTLAAAEDDAASQTVLFMHMPLFVRYADETLDASDFQNSYLVLPPPGRDRLLGLIGRHHVCAVLSGHLHSALDLSHTWPDGFVTRFITTGSSGCPSSMAIDQFGLDTPPEHGIGFHMHRLDHTGLHAHYHEHDGTCISGHWHLGQSRVAWCPSDTVPEPQEGAAWYQPGFVARAPVWEGRVGQRRHRFAGGAGAEYYVRQTFEVCDDSAAIHLEIGSDCAVEVYLNGVLLSRQEALRRRPPVWQSADGSKIIDGPRMALGLNQRLVFKGDNLLALRFSCFESSPQSSTIEYRQLEPEDQVWH
jgi:hypothetical protein